MQTVVVGASATNGPKQLMLQPTRMSAFAIEHPVIVRAVLRHFVEHVSVLDDLAFLIETENVDACIVRSLWPELVTMQDHVVNVLKGALDLYVFARVFPRHPLEVVDEGVLAVCDVRIVPSVLRSGEARDRFTKATVIEHHLVEGNDIRLISSWIAHRTALRTYRCHAASRTGFPRLRGEAR